MRKTILYTMLLVAAAGSAQAADKTEISPAYSPSWLVGPHKGERGMTAAFNVDVASMEKLSDTKIVVSMAMIDGLVQFAAPTNYARVEHDCSSGKSKVVDFVRGWDSNYFGRVIPASWAASPGISVFPTEAARWPSEISQPTRQLMQELFCDRYQVYVRPTYAKSLPTLEEANSEIVRLNFRYMTPENLSGHLSQLWGANSKAIREAADRIDRGECTVEVARQFRMASNRFNRIQASLDQSWQGSKAYAISLHDRGAESVALMVKTAGQCGVDVGPINKQGVRTPKMYGYFVPCSLGEPKCSKPIRF